MTRTALIPILMATAGALAAPPTPIPTAAPAPAPSAPEKVRSVAHNPAPPAPKDPPSGANPSHAPQTQAHPQSPAAAPSSSMLAQAIGVRGADSTVMPGGGSAVSLFAIKSADSRAFKPHDLVQIIVRETSQTKRSQDIETKKKYKLDGKISSFPDFNLADLLELQLFAGRTTDMPKVGVDVKNDYKGEGEYSRKDDMTDRLTATVVDVLPNGNLVLEARTSIKTDDEESVMKVTGLCRTNDITAANTVLSNQIFDLKIERQHKGEIKDGAQKGILAKLFDTVFAF